MGDQSNGYGGSLQVVDLQGVGVRGRAMRGRAMRMDLCVGWLGCLISGFVNLLSGGGISSTSGRWVGLICKLTPDAGVGFSIFITSFPAGGFRQPPFRRVGFVNLIYLAGDHGILKYKKVF